MTRPLNDIDLDRVSFFIHKGSYFSVEIKAWKYSCRWNWNVYANFMEGHALFESSNHGILHRLEGLNGGITFEQEITSIPLGGIKYDFQREHKKITIGSDYMHYGDEDYSFHNPVDGIPVRVYNDAKILVNSIIKLTEELP